VVYLFGKDHISDAIYHLSTKYLHIFQVFVCRFVFLAIYLSMLYIMKLPLYVDVEIILNSPEHSVLKFMFARVGKRINKTKKGGKKR